MDDKTKNYTGWQSDVIVDMIKRYGFPFITLNPGASFRGLHDSLVNYGNNEPPMMLCNHEEIAVQIAHGYAKATGKPAAVILHDLVGLLHACMAIYYAYLDRVPIFIMGATGPMDEAKRRPHIDWTHTALVQGNAVRDYTKWDYQPTSIHGVPESFARAYSIMMTEPKGPIYMCYDAAMQEAPMTEKVALPPDFAVHVPSPMAPDPKAIEKIADKLLKAEHPMLLAEYAGRRENGFNNIVALAETTGAGGVGRQQRAQLPEQASALHEHGQAVAQAHRPRARARPQGLGEAAQRAQQQRRGSLNRWSRQNCDYVEIGFGELNISKWAMDYCRMQPCSVRALGDTEIGIPELTRICKERIAKDPGLKKKIEDRKTAIGKRHDEVWNKWQQDAKKNWDASPITFQRLAMEVWEVIKNEDWVLTANNLKQEVRKLWDFDKPYRHPGRRARHLDADRHLARRCDGVQGAGPARGQHQSGRRPDVRRRRALDRRQVQDPDAGGDAQQPRLLQRLGAPDPHGQAARHRRGQGPYRHGPVRSGARLRRARARHGLLRRRPDRQARRHPPCARARARGGQEGPARAGGYDHAAPLNFVARVERSETRATNGPSP